MARNLVQRCRLISCLLTNTRNNIAFAELLPKGVELAEMFPHTLRWHAQLIELPYVRATLPALLRIFLTFTRPQVAAGMAEKALQEKYKKNKAKA